MSQLATSMSALTNKPDRLPSQTIQNPKGNVSAVTLRSGRKLVVQPMEPEEEEDPRFPREEQLRPKALGILEQDAAEKSEDAPEEEKDSPEEEKDVAEEEGNAPEERRPGPVPAASPVPASEEHSCARCPEPRPPKAEPLFHFQCKPEYQNNMSWMRTCLNCLARSRSTSPSWKPSSKSLDMLSF
ncbi:unnamed protein product [Rhodiola kirilowii]